MKVLVTGSTSLIGQHVVALLLQRGDEVTVLQRTSSNLKNVREILCDIADPRIGSESDKDNPKDSAIHRAMAGMDAVVHLAAKVGVAGRWSTYEAVNIHGTQRLVQIARQCNIRRFVHVSSPSVAHAGKSLIGAAAGSAEPELVRGHYARSKACGEQIALAANCDDMHVVVLRPHLVWGPDDKQLVQRIIERAKAKRLLLVGNGMALIDTTYIDNAASAIVAGIDNARRAAGQPLVISNGQPRPVSEIMQRILKAANLPTRVRCIPSPVAIGAGAAIEKVWDILDKKDDPPMTRFLAEQLATAHWFDQRTTQAVLDWKPVIGLEEGFERLAASLAH